jgi:hypothetical protein
MKEITYTVSSKKPNRNATFIPLPVKWKWRKGKNDTTVTIGGSKQSPAQIKCTLLPKYKCTPKGGTYFQMAEKTL